MTYYEHILDRVELKYDDAIRTYSAVFTKTILNTSDQPIQWFYARIAVSTFLRNADLSSYLYSKSPVSLADIGFRAYDNTDRDLQYTILRQHPSNIELRIHLFAAHSRRPMHLLPGRKATAHYAFAIGDHWWGPWLQRHIRVPTAKAEVCLLFRKEVASVWGEYCTPQHDWQPMALPNGALNRGTQFEAIKWQVANPRVQSRYRFCWEFADQRERALEKDWEDRRERDQISAAGSITESKVAIASGLCKVSNDYRSLQWYGTSYALTERQAACLRLLWSAWLDGLETVSGDQLIVAASASSGSRRLSDIFRNSPMWGNVVVTVGKGMYKLQVPSTRRPTA